MLKREVEIGKVYVVKLSTGRMARMKAERWIPNSRNGCPDRLLMRDVDKPALTKYCTAARLRYPVGGIVVPEGMAKIESAC